MRNIIFVLVLLCTMAGPVISEEFDTELAEKMEKKITEILQANLFSIDQGEIQKLQHINKFAEIPSSEARKYIEDYGNEKCLRLLIKSLDTVANGFEYIYQEIDNKETRKGIVLYSFPNEVFWGNFGLLWYLLKEVPPSKRTENLEKVWPSLEKMWKMLNYEDKLELAPYFIHMRIDILLSLQKVEQAFQELIWQYDIYSLPEENVVTYANRFEIINTERIANWAISKNLLSRKNLQHALSNTLLIKNIGYHGRNN